MNLNLRLPVVILLFVFAAVQAGATCAPADRTLSADDLVAKIEAEDLRYVFVGEQHDVGPVKRFAVDLVNALAASGSDVGLYVEGFRTNCRLGDFSCWSLARAFNIDAFQRLLDESVASVHAIDPPETDRRAARMAAVIAEGSETVRVVLVGKSHVIHAWDPDAELWVFGGGLKFPDPGDLAEAFPRSQVMTIGLETSEVGGPPYSLTESGCGLDFVLTTHPTRDYWGELEEARVATRAPPRGIELTESREELGITSRNGGPGAVAEQDVSVVTSPGL